MEHRCEAWHTLSVTARSKRLGYKLCAYYYRHDLYLRRMDKARLGHSADRISKSFCTR